MQTSSRDHRKRNVLAAKVVKSPTWMQLGLNADLRVHAAFYNHSLRVTRRPVCHILLVVCIVVAVALLGGQEAQRVHRGLAPLYADQQSGFVQNVQTFGLRQYVDVILTHRDNAPEFTNQRLAARTVQPRNVLTEEGFASLHRVRTAVEQASTNKLTFAQACLPSAPSFDLDIREKRLMRVTKQGEPCLVLHGGWSLAEAQLRDATVTKKEGTVPTAQFFGGIKRDAFGNLTSATSMRVVWEIQPNVDDSATQYQTAHDDVERVLLEIQNRVISTNADLVDYEVFVTTAKPLAVVTSQGFLLAGAGVVFLLIVASASLHERWYLLSSMAGLICTVAACYCAVPILSLFGPPPSQFVISAYFVAVLVGVDDVFVLMFAVRRANKGSVERRMATAIGESATAIFMTTLTDLAVFLAGTYGASPATVAFCLTTVIALAVDFLFQMTFFVAVLSLEMRWNDRRDASAQQRGSCCMCTKQAVAQDEADDDEKTQEATEARREANRLGASMLKAHTNASAVVEIESLRASDRRDSSVALGEGNADGSSRRTSFTGSTRSGGRLSGEQSRGGDDMATTARSFISEMSDAFVKREVPIPIGFALKKYGAKYATRRSGWAVCSLLSLALLGLALCGAFMPWTIIVGYQDAGTGNDQRLAWRAEQLARFPEAFETLEVLLSRGIAYHDPLVAKKVLTMCHNMEAVQGNWLVGMQPRCWLRDYAGTLNGTSALPTDASAFNAGLRAMGATEARYDVMWNGVEIDRTRMVMFVRRPRTAEEAFDLQARVTQALGSEVAYKLSAVELADAVNEQLLTDSLLWAALIAVASVGCVSAILLINPFSALIVMTSMLVSLGCVLGVLILVDFQFTVYTLCSLVIAFGIGMDQTGHMCLTFNTINGKHPQTRIERTFGSAGPSIWYSGLSNLCVGLLYPFMEGNGAVISILLFLVSFFGWLVSWVMVPLLLQLLKFPPALRDVQLEMTLRERKTPLDEIWLEQYSK